MAQSVFSKLIRDPFVQFLLAGIAIYVAFALTATEDPEVRDRQIILDASTLEWIHNNFTKQMRRPPTPNEMDALIHTHIEHEVKYREALNIGLDDRDSIVQRRLVQKFDFLFGDAAAEMNPDDSVLQAWYDQHRTDYEIPATISFTHHWFSPDTRKAAAQSDARTAVAVLNAGETVEADRFPFDTTFTTVREDEVRRVFGQTFVDQLFAIPLDTWAGPVESGLGYHAVRVAARTDKTIPPLDQVRDIVLEAWRRAESQQILKRTLAELLDEYTVAIDDEARSALEYAPETQGNAL